MRSNAKGTVVTDDGEYFSASMLADPSFGDLPNSRAGIYKMAEREKWPFINIPGRGARDGVRYFKLPEALLAKLEGSSESSVQADHEKISRKHETFVSDYASDRKVCVEGYSAISSPSAEINSKGLIDRVEFSASGLSRLIGIPARHLKVMSVHGYNMEPFLSDGDQVFIDTRFNTFKDDGVYAILHDSELRYQRVRVNYADHTVLIKSDNDGGLGPEILNEAQMNGLQILGKVIPFKFGHFKL